MIVRDRERPQSLDSIGNDLLHDAAEMQAAHHAVDRDIRKQMPHLGADIDDAGMRARAQHNQPQILDMGHQHALVEQQRIGLPRSIRTDTAQMIDATLFKNAPPWDLAAIVEMAVEQQSCGRVVDDIGALRRHLFGGRHLGGRDNRAAAELNRALVEHAGVDVDGRVSAFLADRVQWSPGAPPYGPNGHG